MSNSVSVIACDTKIASVQLLEVFINPFVHLYWLMAGSMHSYDGSIWSILFNSQGLGRDPGGASWIGQEAVSTPRGLSMLSASMLCAS